jgi:uncharacterized protein YbaR (Trm112 family)/SAM-dependent methyltransferase
MVPPLVCPGCRIQHADRLELQTMARVDDLLVCGCGRSYPIVDEIPIVLADPTAFLARESTAILERDLPPAVAARLVEGGPDDAAYPRLLEHLSVYLDAHWGDLATPPVPAAGEAILARVTARREAPVRAAIELGCSVGRGLAALAAGAAHVTGVELQFAALRRARRLLDGAPLPYPRRQIGRHYTPAVTRCGPHGVPAERRTLVCGDALDPPLPPEVYGRVLALNLLDTVRRPGQLVAVLDGLCAPGGELILTSPYAWQSAHVDDAERPGGPHPERWLRALLEAGTGLRARYEIEDEAELPWTLRRDARSTVSYTVHYLRARKR